MVGKIAHKIPLFKGFSLDQSLAFFNAGLLTRVARGQSLCKEGGPSTRLFVLVAGALKVEKGGRELAEVKPIDIVGEMGFVTDEPRSATVTVTEVSTVFSIGKTEFVELMRDNPLMEAKIYKNMLCAVVEKLRQTNALI